MDCRNLNVLKCGLINIQSIRNKSLEIREFITDNHIDILLITESWLKGTVADKTIINESTPDSHRFCHVPRQDKKGGGVAVIINKICTNVYIDSSFKAKSYEYIDISFTISNRKFRMLNIYRPYGTPFNPFLAEFESHLDSLTGDRGQLILTGDFNCWVEIEDHRPGIRFKELLDLHNLKIFNSGPTSRDGHTLDLVISNSQSNFLDNFDTFDYFSHVHFYVGFNIIISRRPTAKKKIQFRQKKNFNPSTFIARSIIELDEKAETPCLCSNTHYSKADECAHCYTNLFNTIFSKNYDLMCPLTCKVIREEVKNKWYNAEINNAKREKRKCELNWRKNKNESNRILYKEARNRLNRLLFRSKKNFYMNKLTEADGDSKKLYNILNEISGGKKEKLLPYESSDEVLAQKFSKFFDEKVERLMTELEETTVNNETANDIDGVDVVPGLHNFNTVQEVDIFKLIMSTKKTYNSNDPFPIKDVSQEENIKAIARIYTKIINLSILNNKFPNSEKVAVVHPLYKGDGDANNMKYYRPVSNLSFLSKIIEKSILLQLNRFLLENNLIPDNQSAYRANHSTETCITAVLNDLLNSLDDGKITLMFMLDLSAAFDTVHHQVLKEELMKIGIQDSALAWISNYLDSRFFRVEINDQSSQKVPLQQGVPQGSVLGPVLFLLYVRGLGKLFADASVSHQQFADDSQGYEVIGSVQVSIPKILSLILKIKQWLAGKFQKLNEDKTKFMLIGSKKKLKNLKNSHNLKFFILNGHKVKLQSSLKDLGVFIDENLTCNKQISILVKSCNNQLQNLYAIKKYVTRNCLKMLVVNQILSRIDYCNSIYVNLPNYQLRKIQMCMNKSARLIHGARFTDRVTPLLINLHWLPIKARIMFKICCQVKKVLITGKPNYLKPHLIRTRTRLQVPRVKTMFGKRAFKYYAPTVYNSLPLSLREIDNVANFKRKLKTHLFSLAYDRDTLMINPDFKV